jgi:hypothetical protein
MKTFILLLLLLCSLTLHAEDKSTNDLPLHCFAKAYRFVGDKLQLNVSGGKLDQKLYLIKNTAASKIWLNHETERVSASAGWATELEPGNWTAIMLAKQPFDIVCVELKPGAEQHISCQATLSVCQMEYAKFSAASKGSYWVAENLSLEKLLDKITRRGISLSTK